MGKERLALTCSAAGQAAQAGLPQRRQLKRSAGSLRIWLCLLERSPGWGTLHDLQPGVSMCISFGKQESVCLCILYTSLPSSPLHPNGLRRAGAHHHFFGLTTDVWISARDNKTWNFRFKSPVGEIIFIQSSEESLTWDLHTSDV